MKAAKTNSNQQVDYPNYSKNEDQNVVYSPNPYPLQYQYENQPYENFYPQTGSPQRRVEPYYHSNQIYHENAYSHYPPKPRNYENTVINPYSGGSPNRVYNVSPPRYSNPNNYSNELQAVPYDIPASNYPATQYYPGASPQRTYKFPPANYPITNFSPEVLAYPHENQGYIPSKAYRTENNFYYQKPTYESNQVYQSKQPRVVARYLVNPQTGEKKSIPLNIDPEDAARKEVEEHHEKVTSDQNYPKIKEENQPVPRKKTSSEKMDKSDNENLNQS